MVTLPALQGNVGCIVDPELIVSYDQSFNNMGYSNVSTVTLPFLPTSSQSGLSTSSTSPLGPATPDTAFYQWVPFLLLLQVAEEEVEIFWWRDLYLYLDLF